MEKKFLRRIGQGFFLLGTAYSLVPAFLVLILGPIRTEWFGHKISIDSLIEPWQTGLLLFFLGGITKQITQWIHPERSSPSSSGAESLEAPLPVRRSLKAPGSLNKLLQEKRSRKFFPSLFRPSWLVICLFLGLLGWYGSHLFQYKSTAVTGCDTYAYLQGSVLMIQQGIWHTEMVDPLIPQLLQRFQHPLRPEEVLFFLSPHGHYVYDFFQGTVYNVFPPGLSWLLWPFIKWGTIQTAFYVIPLINILAVLVFFSGIAKEMDLFFAFSLVAFTFFNFIVFQNTIMIMSDLPSMVFLALSLFFLYRTWEKDNPFLTFGAGLFLGLAWTIRYSNMVGIAPILLLFSLKLIKKKSIKKSFKELAIFLTAAFVFGIIPLAIYTRQHFGTFFTLVYEPYTRSRMAWENFSAGTVYYLNSLYENFGFLEIFLVFGGFFTSLFNPKRRLASLLGILFIISFFLFYSFHSIRHARYLMPVFPFLGLGYAFGVLWLGEWFDKEKWVKIMVLLLLATYPLVEYIQKPFYPGESTQEKSSHLLERQVEKNAVVFCDLMSGPIKLYAGITGYRFCWTEAQVFGETLNILKDFHRPLYFFLDSETARNRFEYWKQLGIFKMEEMKLISEIQGMPLYRVGS